MKAVLKKAWQVAPNDHIRNAVDQAYLFLSHFQDDVGDKPIDSKLPPDAPPEQVLEILGHSLPGLSECRRRATP